MILDQALILNSFSLEVYLEIKNFILATQEGRGSKVLIQELNFQFSI